MTSTAVSKPTSQIRWPRATAADSILCTIVRDTRGVPLDHAQRYNFFPATPLCCVTAVFAGDWHVIERDEEMERPWTGTKVPGLAFSGPQPQPPMSWNPGATFAAMIVLYPDALAAVTGIDLSPFTGRVVAAERALPQKVLGPCRRFFEAVERDRADDGAAGLETEFEVMSAGLRPPAQSANRIRDWKRGVVHRAGSCSTPRDECCRLAHSCASSCPGAASALARPRAKHRSRDCACARPQGAAITCRAGKTVPPPAPRNTDRAGGSPRMPRRLSHAGAAAPA